MTTALKDRYNVAFYKTFRAALEKANPEIDASSLSDKIFIPAFEQYALKERLYHSTRVLHTFLSPNYPTACQQIIKTIEALIADGVGENFEYMFFPDYIETYGIEEFETSMFALAKITGFTSAEFAVRPFIVKYGDRMIQQMIQWTFSPAAKVRRLASEGSRPKLPWAMALSELKKDPSPALPILENLKNDEDEAVRISVANHLNDICKDNPEIAVGIAQKWFGHTTATDALVKHGVRTLLKAGNPSILKLFGLSSEGLVLTDYTLHQTNIQMGERLSFSFKVDNQIKDEKTLRLEYAIYLLKQNNSHSKKVFKISERPIAGKANIDVSKNHHFKPISTRVYYSGAHYVSVILNGKEFERLPFTLVV
jgi:3-methyladenine DNA glycosylase AlkC